MKRVAAAALLTGSVLLMPAMAQAQDAAAIAAELKAMREKIAALEAKVAELEAREAEPSSDATAPALAEAAPPPSPAPPATEIVWRGAPQLRQAETGFSFRPRGFLQFDTGYVENPGNAAATPNLGYATRARRIVFGAEGTLPGGFGYKAEFNFGGGNLDFEDIILTYAPEGSPLQLTAGNFFPLSGLDAVTSSRVISFLEREQAVDAFGFGRRLGLAATLSDSDETYSLTAGIFNAPLNAGFNNDGWQASVRAIYAPQLGEDGRLHLGLNFQHRQPQSDAQNVRYRARPFSQLTDFRFVDTFGIAARGDDILGVELAGIFGPFHFAAEGHRAWVNGYRSGTVFDGFDSAGSGLFYTGDPVFDSAYAEVGLHLTGETRGYRGGRWDNIKVLRPFGKGGWGALRINARIDRLDLSDRVSAGAGAASFVNGGIQTGYQLSAIWNPTDWVRLLLQYSRADIEGGPLPAATQAEGGESPIGRDYSVDSVGLRTQVEF